MVGLIGNAIPPAALGMSLLWSLAVPSALAKAPEYSIPFADRGGIRNWKADGSKGVWIQAAGGKWYYAGFSSPCNSLPVSQGIRFLPDPTGDLSRWSSIRLGHEERCFFRSLQPSEDPPKKIESSKQIPESGTQLESNRAARGWSDLGTPERMEQTLRDMNRSQSSQCSLLGYNCNASPGP